MHELAELYKSIKETLEKDIYGYILDKYLIQEWKEKHKYKYNNVLYEIKLLVPMIECKTTIIECEACNYGYVRKGENINNYLERMCQRYSGTVITRRYHLPYKIMIWGNKILEFDIDFDLLYTYNDKYDSYEIYRLHDLYKYKSPYDRSYMQEKYKLQGFHRSETGKLIPFER